MSRFSRSRFLVLLLASFLAFPALGFATTYKVSYVKKSFGYKSYPKEEPKEDPKEDPKEEEPRDEDPKVTICHGSNGLSQSLEVVKSELIAHLLHGDKVGPCPSSPKY